jgi:DNA-binding response OmpR family regulator
LRILILDDEPLISDMLQDWLAELRCEAIGPVETAAGALGLIDAEPLDGAILDVSLRGGDSFQVARELRNRGVPFAFATGYDRGDVATEFPEAGILRKPFSLEDLKVTLVAFRKS